MSAANKKIVMIVGSGGREHALAWKLAQSPQVAEVIVAPGNDGMPDEYRRMPCDLNLGKPEFARIGAAAQGLGVSLVVIGPDNPLADGIVNELTDQGLLVFGPTRAAARLESSKAFAKEVMREAGVPTARFVAVATFDEARQFLSLAPWDQGGWVVKADGLALGKGVLVCESQSEALDACAKLLTTSSKLVIEERVTGEEISWIALCDGERAALMDPARDHKRLLDGDLGPNTGGMGVYSPIADLPSTLRERVRAEVFLPTLKAMSARGVPFQGALFAGLMWNRKTDRLTVLEFNARMGDPETQALLPRMEGDLLTWLEGCAKGDLTTAQAQGIDVPFKNQTAVAVVAAARGYPDAPVKGAEIVGTGDLRDLVFFAGVKRGAGLKSLCVSGGRVLCVVGMGLDHTAARTDAYAQLKKIHFDGMQLRSDIGRHRAGDVST